MNKIQVNRPPLTRFEHKTINISCKHFGHEKKDIQFDPRSEGKFVPNPLLHYIYVRIRMYISESRDYFQLINSIFSLDVICKQEKE